jgi:hypothetical protein
MLSEYQIKSDTTYHIRYAINGANTQSFNFLSCAIIASATSGHNKIKGCQYEHQTFASDSLSAPPVKL